MRLYVENDTDRMRSTFTTIGLASLLHKIGGVGRGRSTKIVDAGSAFIIESDVEWHDFEVYLQNHNGRLPILLPAIFKPLTSKELKLKEQGVAEEELLLKYVPRGFSDVPIDYAYEKDKPLRGQLSKEQAEHGEGIEERNINFPVWGHLVSYFGKGSAMRVAYPTVIHAWHAHQDEAALGLTNLIRNIYSEFPNQIEEAQDVWEKDFRKQLAYQDVELRTTIASVAVVSPSTSKGSYSESVRSGLSEGTPTEFWLPMYLALAGYMIAGMPFRLPDGDVSLYYPLPHEIEFTTLQNMMTRYRNRNDVANLYRLSGLMPYIKVDSLSYLTFYQTMIQHYRDNTNEENASKWEQVEPNMITGLAGYYYKDISTQIPFNENVFALPVFLPQEPTVEELDIALTILGDHQLIIQRMPSDTSDELQVLGDYHNFAIHGEADDWVQFCVSYGLYRFTHMEDKQFLALLSVQLMEETLMALSNEFKDYRPVLGNEGFQRIARIIRECTVTLRYFKDVKNQTTGFKVRHGLGADLLRRSHNADDFIQDLSEFLHDYARESSNVHADTGETRAFFTDTDIAEIIALVHQYGSKVVASLLVASGYASSYDRSKSN